jgi:hypothetical protein
MSVYCDNFDKNELTIEGKIPFGRTTKPKLKLFQKNNVPHYYGINKLKCQSEEHKKINMSHKIKLYPHQEKIYKKIMDTLLKQKSVFLALRCGYGKTMMSMKIIVDLGLEALVIVNRNTHKISWSNEIKNHTNVNFDILSSRKKTSKKPIHIISIQTLEKSNFQLEYDRYGIVILDEAIEYCTQLAVFQILRFKPSYFVGLCADFEGRYDGFDRALEYFFGPKTNFIIKKYDGSSSVIKINTEFKPKIELTRGWGGVTVDWNATCLPFIRNEKRNEMIAKFIYMYRNVKMLFMSKYVEHCQLMQKEIEKMGLKSVVYTGNMKTYDDCDIVLTTFSKAGRGFDEKNVVKNFNGRRISLIILGIPLKKPEQYFGRAFRSLNPLCLYFVDDCSTFRRHWDQSEKWFTSIESQIHETWI